jgi:hypothetical protein
LIDVERIISSVCAGGVERQRRKLSGKGPLGGLPHRFPGRIDSSAFAELTFRERLPAPTESKINQLISASFGAVPFIGEWEDSGCCKQGQVFDPAYHTHYTRIEDPDPRCEAKTKKQPALDTTTKESSENLP